MKNPTTLIFVLLLAASSSFSQIMFQKTYGTNAVEYCYAILQTADGGFILGGETDSLGQGSYDAWLMKTDSTGNQAWTKSYGGVEWDWINVIRQTTDGGYIVTGGTESAGTGYLLLMKLDADGNNLWQKRYGGAIYNNGYDVLQTSDGGYVACGYLMDDTVSNTDAFLVRTDASGNLLWAKSYSSGSDLDLAYSIQQTQDGGFIIAGEKYAGTTGTSLLIKTDANGDVEWANGYNATVDNWMNTILALPGGDYAIVGGNITSGSRNTWFARLDSTGGIITAKSYNGAFSDNFWGMILTQDGGFAMCGSSNSFSVYYEALWMKTDSAGNQQSLMRYGGNSDDYSNEIVMTSDGGFAMAGITYSFGSAENTYLLKTNADGETGCNEASGILTMSTITAPPFPVTITVNNLSEFTTSLTANTHTLLETQHCFTTGIENPSVKEALLTYPNPASDKLHFSYSKSLKTIEIYNSLGSAITELEVCPACSEFDISDLENGMYYLIGRCTDQSGVVAKFGVER